MRESLKELIKNTIVKEYELPHIGKSISKTPLSSHKDKCYSVVDDDDFVDIIYNSIIEYSLNELEIDKDDYNKSMSIAIKTKIRENPTISHGFFGEVLLHSLLRTYFNTDVIIARGYFYNPTSKNEVTGFDSYHLIQMGDKVALWWGEAKFRTDYYSSIIDIITKINYTISDEYLTSNVLSFENQKRNLNVKGSIIEKILNDFNDNPDIVIADKLVEYNASLVYPVLLIYDGKEKDYDSNITKMIEYMQTKYNEANIDISCSIDYKIFFMIIPINCVKVIKEKVIECLECKKPVI